MHTKIAAQKQHPRHTKITRIGVSILIDLRQGRHKKQ